MAIYTKTQIKNLIEDNLSKLFGVQGSEASENELYKACATTVNDILRKKRGKRIGKEEK